MRRAPLLVGAAAVVGSLTTGAGQPAASQSEPAAAGLALQGQNYAVAFGGNVRFEFRKGPIFIRS